MSEEQTTDTAANFTLMLETACRDFEALLHLVRRDARIKADEFGLAFNVAAAVNTSLAKSFVFHTIRAGRIAEHGPSELPLNRVERTQFKKIADDVLGVRDVNEHGYDRHKKGGGQVTRPAIHLHHDLGVALDETSLTILGEHEILMGPLNLRRIYERVKPFQLRYGVFPRAGK